MTIPSLLSYEIEDELGVTASMTHFVNIPTATTLAQIQTFVNDYTPLLQAVTDGQITGITVKIPLVITGGASAPVAGSEVERTGLINFEQSGSNYKQAIDILALSEGLIISGKIDYAQKRYKAGDAYFEAGLAIFERLNNREDLADNAALYAQLLEQHGDVHRAVTYWKKAFDSRRRMFKSNGE